MRSRHKSMHTLTAHQNNENYSLPSSQQGFHPMLSWYVGNLHCEIISTEGGCVVSWSGSRLVRGQRTFETDFISLVSHVLKIV